VTDTWECQGEVCKREGGKESSHIERYTGVQSHGENIYLEIGLYPTVLGVGGEADMKMPGRGDRHMGMPGRDLYKGRGEVVK